MKDKVKEILESHASELNNIIGEVTQYTLGGKYTLKTTSGDIVFNIKGLNNSNMETNKQYKRVPFDIELAKKIQSGEIEGYIGTKHDGGSMPVEILSFNVLSNYPIAAKGYFYPVLNVERVLCFSENGASEDKIHTLFIELPEETPKQDSFTKKLHDTAEVLATPKHEFNVGDKVKICCPESSENTIRKHNGEILTVECVLENGVSVYNDETGLFLKFDEIEHFEEKKQEVSNGAKHEFKPFDKVLVREDESDVWICRLFDRFFQDKGGLGYCCQDGISYDFCIPYEGNEHLVGTTNNPE